MATSSVPHGWSPNWRRDRPGIFCSVATLPAVWSFADIANGLMAVPNLVALIALNGVIVAETRAYLWSGNLDRTADH